MQRLIFLQVNLQVKKLYECIGFLFVFLSMEKLPFDTDAIKFIISVDFPHPGSPCIKVIFPNGMYGYHSQSTVVSVTLLYSFSCPEQKSIISNALSSAFSEYSLLHSYS